jgi:hypothetical protein
MLALRQTLANRLDTCLVLADNHAVYFGASGDSQKSETPPAGGSVLSGQLLPAIDFLESEDIRARREELEAFAAQTRANGGHLMGDLTKGGRPATEEEMGRLAGTEADGRPVGLQRCARCRGYHGTCLDPSEDFRGQVMTVHCACENRNRCARCGEQLYEHRLNANYYDPADGHIWHVPGFCGLSHRCDCRAINNVLRCRQ